MINYERKRFQTQNNLSFIYLKVVKRFEVEARVHIPPYSILSKRGKVFFFFTAKDIPRIMLCNRSLNSSVVVSNRCANSYEMFSKKF